MDILTFLSKRVFNPFYDRHNGINNKKIIQELTKSQYYSRDEILDRQWQKLKSILKFVYDNNKYYRQRFENEGVVPEDIKTPDDFTRLPFLTKDDIRNHKDEMISRGYKPEELMPKMTGGSTGVPLELFWDNSAKIFKHALVYRHNGWAGLWPGVKQAAIWGDTDQKKNLKEKLYFALAVRVICLDALKINETEMHNFAASIRKFRPKIIFGHGHSLYTFASFLKENDIADLKFDGIISAAEALSRGERTLVEEMFNSTVFDRYGCEEVSLIASECECHDGLHLASEGLYVENLGGDDATPGKLIITDLTNRAMPFIRYEIGDLATTKSGPCKCGRGLPRLGQIFGRTSDVLYTPDGRMISGISLLDHLTIPIPGIKQSQIVQEKIDEIVFNIIRSSDFTDDSVAILEREIPKYFGDKMNYRLNYVDTIPLTKRGKFQYTICKIEKP